MFCVFADGVSVVSRRSCQLWLLTHSWMWVTGCPFVRGSVVRSLVRSVPRQDNCCVSECMCQGWELPEAPGYIITLLRYVRYCKIIYCNFLNFLNCKSQSSQSQTLSASSVSSYVIHVSVYSSPFNNFLLHFLKISPVSTQHHQWTEKSTNFFCSKIQKAGFIFATFFKNLFNKILILGIFEMIQHHHSKYRDITMYRFFFPPLRCAGICTEALHKLMGEC